MQDRLFSQFSPTTAGFLRGAVGAVVSAAIGAAITYLTDTPNEAFALYTPFILLTLRTIEGRIDAGRKSTP